MIKMMAFLMLIASSQMTWSLDIYKCQQNGTQKIQSTPCNDYSKSRHLADSKPILGMTSHQVKKTTWGKPAQIHQKKDEKGQFEQWVYENKHSKMEKSLNFRNGILVAVNH